MEALLQKVVNGDAASWQALWEAVQPSVWAITGKWQITGPIARREDDRRNIVLQVMDRLRADDFRRIRCFLESTRTRQPGSSFRTWLATVTARVAIDYVRAHPEYLDRRAHGAGERWVRVVSASEFPQDLDGPSPHDVATAAELLDSARRVLRAEQLTALCLWLQGDDEAGISKALELGEPADGRRLLRSALKRLRDRYAAPVADADSVADGEKIA
ncbi:MAG: sigma-70 family RNA polymerase sigma factor [Deltaproteobacteria bacterium]|nr:sigma-70 family RNA polymerase sigma factor [Deltaproteobacteria bacterium]